jgi:hypothetical protein
MTVCGTGLSVQLQVKQELDRQCGAFFVADERDASQLGTRRLKPDRARSAHAAQLTRWAHALGRPESRGFAS